MQTVLAALHVLVAGASADWRQPCTHLHGAVAGLLNLYNDTHELYACGIGCMYYLPACMQD